MEKLDAEHWHVNDGGHSPGTLFLDSTRKRVWILYSLLDASESDGAVSKWIEGINGLDRAGFPATSCCLSEESNRGKRKGLD